MADVSLCFYFGYNSLKYIRFINFFHSNLFVKTSFNSWSSSKYDIRILSLVLFQMASCSSTEHVRERTLTAEGATSHLMKRVSAVMMFPLHQWMSPVCQTSAVPTHCCQLQSCPLRYRRLHLVLPSTARVCSWYLLLLLYSPASPQDCLLLKGQVPPLQDCLVPLPSLFSPPPKAVVAMEVAKCDPKSPSRSLHPRPKWSSSMSIRVHPMWWRARLRLAKTQRPPITSCCSSSSSSYSGSWSSSRRTCPTQCPLPLLRSWPRTVRPW